MSKWLDENENIEFKMLIDFWLKFEVFVYILRCHHSVPIIQKEIKDHGLSERIGRNIG